MEEGACSLLSSHSAPRPGFTPLSHACQSQQTRPVVPHWPLLRPQITIRSTDVDRTLMSAEANLAGQIAPPPSIGDMPLFFFALTGRIFRAFAANQASIPLLVRKPSNRT